MRALIKKNKTYKNKKTKKHVFYCSFQTAKILRFEKSDKYLTEQDMMNLFTGFLRLIRRSIISEVENEYKKKLAYYQAKIKNILSKLN